MFNNILVPTDGSELSTHAVEQGIALARLSGGKVIALHVMHPYTPLWSYSNFGPSEDVLEQDYVERERAVARNLFSDIEEMAKQAGVPMQTQLVEGDEVYRQILAAAAKAKCDLICMASHGHRGLAAVVLGSETQKVLTHGTTPVLVVH